MRFRKINGKKSQAFAMLSILVFTVVVAANVTPEPQVVMIPGWHGDGAIFDTMIPVLEGQGMTVVDFDDSKPGTQAVSHYASAYPGNLDIPALANQVEENIKARTSSSDTFNFVAHSMGGLIARYLIEKGPSDPNIDDNWADRVNILFMLGTPNHGTWEAYVGQVSLIFGDWAASAAQMIPGSAFLESLGYAEPAGEHYITFGGNPWYLPNFDGVVSTDSPRLTGAEHYVFDAHHGELATKPNTIDFILETLGYTPQDMGEALPLQGTAFIRLEYLKMTGDHEWGDEEYYMDVYVDKDGGNNNYVLQNTLYYSDDGPFTWNPGNYGPNTATFALPGTSPRMDVKIVLREDGDTINVFYFRDMMYSEDLDGMDYYSDTAPDPDGTGNNEIRISINGVTSDVARTVNVKLVMTQVQVNDDGDWGEGENYFVTEVGRSGYELRYAEWSYWYGEDTYMIYDTYAQNSGYDAVFYTGLILREASLHVHFELWDDDGGWSYDDKLSVMDTYFTAEDAGGSYYSNTGNALWWYSITVTEP